jgi:hypothetical protein
MKLNRLAMHQEWFDKNEFTIYLEARAVMRELLAMAKERTKERDEARREVCYQAAELDMLTKISITPESVAKEYNWDCFKTHVQ